LGKFCGTGYSFGKIKKEVLLKKEALKLKSYFRKKGR